MKVELRDGRFTKRFGDGSGYSYQQPARSGESDRCEICRQKKATCVLGVCLDCTRSDRRRPR